MRRPILLAVALCAAALTHATTLTWSTSTPAAPGTYTLGNNGITDARHFSVALTYTPSANTSNWRMVACLYTTSSNDSGLRLQWGDSGTGFVAYGYASDGTPTVNTEGSPIALSGPTRLIFTRNGDTLSLYVGGELKLSFDLTEGSSLWDAAATSIRLGVASPGSVSAGTYADAGFYDTVLDAAEIAKLTDTSVALTSVPEPTALAVLALGAAGLALRRKRA